MNKYEETINQIKESYNPNPTALKNIESFIFWLWERAPNLLETVEVSQYFNDGIILEWANEKGRVMAEINDKETRYHAKLSNGETFAEKHPVPIKVVDDAFEVLKVMY